MRWIVAAGLTVALVVGFGLVLRQGPRTPEPVEGQHPIVAVGDSYTSGTGAPEGQAFPDHLERSLDVPVVNAGAHGETAEEARPRLERDVLAHEPRLAIVEFGVNEAFRGHPVNRTAEALDALVEPIRERGIPVVLVGVHFRDYQENFDRALQNLSEEHETGLVLDVLDGVLEDPDTRSDRYHPNGDGYEIMAERVRPAVEQRLAGQPADRQAST